MQYLVVGLIIVGVIGIYIASYYFNQKTEVPEGIEPMAKCETCHSGSCSFKGMSFKELVNQEMPDDCEVKRMD